MTDVTVPVPVEVDLFGASLTRTSLDLPPDMSFDDWSAYGAQLSRVAEGVMWWVGDWWRYGERRYGERAAQALDADTYAYQTYRNAAWVAGRVEPSRRRDSLSWSHHAEVASLEARQVLDPQHRRANQATPLGDHEVSESDMGRTGSGRVAAGAGGVGGPVT